MSLDFIFPESDAAGIACNAGFVAAEVLMDIICLFARVGMAVFYLRLVATRQEDVREGATGLVACMSYCRSLHVVKSWGGLRRGRSDESQ